jgi:hypothetical protein
MSDRKAKLKAWREGEKAKARAEYPLDDARLGEFFRLLEELRAAHGCFRDLRHASAAIAQLALSDADADALFDWCNDHGGYCDCEIAANTFGRWQEIRPPG